MRNTPIDASIVENAIKTSGISDLGKASIREIVRLVNTIEEATGQKFVRMEMGVPGLNPPEVGLQAEINALKQGVPAAYPMIEGLDELKKESSRFAKLFLDISIHPEGCIPTVGSMQGGLTAFLVTNRAQKAKDTTLFIDPGFPVQKQQHKVMGLKYDHFDVYDFRGPKLKDKLKQYFDQGHIAAMVYSNPNNPSWICLTQKELEIIGSVASDYDAVVIEDLAYFGMDFRCDYSVPGKPPYQPTVAHYTDNYILLVSSSKIFSYAGQRIGVLMIADKLFACQFPDLVPFYSTSSFGRALIYGALYSLSSGTSHSAQYALAAMLKAANDGTLNFVDSVREYGEKARIMKKMFLDNGFYFPYDHDEDKPLADGFYFTVAYKGFSGAQLLEQLLYYGISAITLDITGSSRTEGLRACVSQVQRSQFPDLEIRLKRFRLDHA